MAQPTTQLFRMSPARLADWLEAQGPDLWWTVDGDDLLLGTITLPTTADRLAARLRMVNKTLIVLDPLDLQPGPLDPTTIDLNEIADKDNPRHERIFCMRWDDPKYPGEWLLCEDKYSAELAKEIDDPEDFEGAHLDGSSPEADQGDPRAPGRASRGSE